MTIKSILLVSLLAITSASFAQDTPDWVKCYTYDASGNRTQRSLGVKSLNPPSDDGGNKGDEEVAGQKSLDNTINWKVYPNPTFGLVNYELNFSEEQRINIAVYDHSGKRLLTQRIKSLGFGQIDLSNLSSGDYILEVTTRTDKSSWNIMKR